MLKHRRGHSLAMSKLQDYQLDFTRVDGSRLPPMPKVDTEDLVDAREVANLLGLSHPNSVSTYGRRYPDMPNPVVDLGRGRCRMWLRTDIERWSARRKQSR